MSYKPIIHYHKSGAPAVIGQMEAGRFTGKWRGFYPSGAPMWEADGGWFTGMGLAIELFEQIMDCKNDLDEDDEERDPMLSGESFRDEDDSDDDDEDDTDLISFNPLPQGDVKLISFWDEAGNMQVKSGSGRAFHRVERSFEHNGRRYLGTPKSYSAQFADGVHDGVYREYYDGELGVEVPYKMGVRHGIERWWFESGKLMSLEQWEDDKPVGMAFHWDWDGRLEKVVKHAEGKERIIACWDEDGKLTARNGTGYRFEDPDTIYYFDGEEVIFDGGWYGPPQHVPGWFNKIVIPNRRGAK